MTSSKLTLFATDYAIQNRLTPFISMQNHYNLVYREEEREMTPTLKVSFDRVKIYYLEYPLTLDFSRFFLK